jgi:hypothetical protein
MLGRWRSYVIGAVVGVVLMLGGQALADIPDDSPSAPDSTKTLYWCWRDSSQPHKMVYLFDRSQALAQGKSDCSAVLGPGWHTVEGVPDAVRETSD